MKEKSFWIFVSKKMIVDDVRRKALAFVGKENFVFEMQLEEGKGRPSKLCTRTGADISFHDQSG